jgi:hypothetical protein
MYILDSDEMTWERQHPSIPIWGLGLELGQEGGHLVEWPVIITGKQLHFNDTEVGQIISTPIMATEVILK